MQSTLHALYSLIPVHILLLTSLFFYNFAAEIK